MNFKPLIAEKDEDGTYKNISLGRIAFWIVFGMAVYTWGFGTSDINPSHIQMLYITTTYNLMKKATWFTSMRTKDGGTMEMGDGDSIRNLQRNQRNQRNQRPVINKHYGGTYTEYNDDIEDPYDSPRLG